MRECFGDYMGKTCQGHHGCPHEGPCFTETSLTKGECDCPHKASCHLPRQWLASMLKQEQPDYVCGFIEMFEERQKNSREWTRTWKKEKNT